MIKNRKQTITGFVICIFLLCALFFVNLGAGSKALSASEILLALKGAGDAVNIKVVLGIRLPRILGVILLGGALSVSGFLLQTFFLNPMAGPFVLGISSGAKLFVALFMISFMKAKIPVSSFGMIVFAFMGAMVSMGFVILVSGKVKSMSVLIICGIMISYICSAVTDFIVTFADDSNIVNLHNWSLGSFSGLRMENIRLIFPVVFFGLVFCIRLSKSMDALRLGEDYAVSMGVDIKLIRVLLIILSSLLAATVTAFVGPVSFVGIAVPHLIRGIFKTSKAIVMIPACFLGGSAFCLFCDLLSRMIFAPTELSISTVTSIIGAPIVISLMLRRSKNG